MPPFLHEEHSRSVSPDSFDRSSIVRALRRFFERRITSLSGDILPSPYQNVSATHLAQFLVERTLTRAALEGAVLSASTGDEPDSMANRALRLKIAALTVLRSLDL
jgi:hypothetical protein